MGGSLLAVKGNDFKAAAPKPNVNAAALKQKLKGFYFVTLKFHW